MKRFLMMAALLCAAGAMAEDVVVKTWDLSKDNQRYVHREKDVEAKAVFADGVYRIEVQKNTEKKGNNNVQFWCTYNNFKAGVKYRVDFTIKASKDVTIANTVMLTAKPWSRIAGKDVSLKAGENTALSLEFSTKEDTTVVYRTPGLFLGMADAGTVFEISDVKLVEVK